MSDFFKNYKAQNNIKPVAPAQPAADAPAPLVPGTEEYNRAMIAKANMTQGKYDGQFVAQMGQATGTPEQAPTPDYSNMQQDLRVSDGGRAQSFVFGSTHEHMSNERQAQFNVETRGDQVNSNVVIDGVTYTPEQIAALKQQGADNLSRGTSDNRGWQERFATGQPQQPQAPAPNAQTPGGKPSGWWRKG